MASIPTGHTALPNRCPACHSWDPELRLKFTTGPCADLWHLIKVEPTPTTKPQPIPMRLPCPECKMLHIDEGEWATRVHHTHSCQYCGLTWRPAVVATVGVRFLPGFKNEPPEEKPPHDPTIEAQQTDDATLRQQLQLLKVTIGNQAKVIAAADVWREALDLPHQDTGCPEFNAAWEAYDTARAELDVVEIPRLP